MEAFLADLVTGVHLAVVLFVVLLPPLVLAGAWRGWAWTPAARSTSGSSARAASWASRSSPGA